MKYDPNDDTFDIEPVNAGGDFETDTGGTQFPYIQQALTDKGTVVGFEFLTPSQAGEMWKVFRISDGAEDTSDPDSF